MKVGILVLFVNSFGIREMYNAQEIGMAKAFADRNNEVIVYKCVASDAKKVDETIYPNVRYICQPVKTIGNNAISNFSWLDTDIDLLVCFSDIQLILKTVYRWAKRHNVKFAPYVGTIESSSDNRVIRTVSNLNAKRTMRFYRDKAVFAKTNAVKEQLEKKGIRNVYVAPVGLDITKLRGDYEAVSKADARKELGLDQKARYLLMVGRLSPGREPLRCVELFERVHRICGDFRLLVVGKGELKDELFAQLSAKGLHTYTDYFESIPNTDMWKAYLAADAFVSFSSTEIFGMSILEAMYYENPVYVMHAPGPNDIIEDGVNGFLFDSIPAMADKILQPKDEDQIGKAAHQRIMEHFLWSRAVDVIAQSIGEQPINFKAARV